MKLLCVGLNYEPEPTGIALYTAGLCEALTKQGHDVRVVTAAPYYPYWKTFSGHGGLRWRRSVEAGVRILRCPIYVPSRVTGLTRITHYLSFLITSFFPILWLAMRQRPDVIINVAPTLISTLPGLLAAKVFGGKSLIHVQDFEVEAAFATNQMASGSLAARLAMRFGDAVLRSHNLATTISPAMVARLNVKRAPRNDVYELRNWADIAAIIPKHSSTYRERWSIKTPNVVLYSGSIGRKQGLETAIEAAKMLDQRGDVTLIICGNGPYREALEEMALGVGCIQFHDLQPKDQLGELLNLATVHLLPQTRDAADLVLPSKLTNMLASGRAIIACADLGTGLALEIADCGILAEPEDPAALAAAITQLIDDPDMQRYLGKAARIRAETVWTGAATTENFLYWLGSATEAHSKTGAD